MNDRVPRFVGAFQNSEIPTREFRSDFMITFIPKEYVIRVDFEFGFEILKTFSYLVETKISDFFFPNFANCGFDRP